MKQGLLLVIYAIIISVTSCDSGIKEISYNNPNDPDGVAYIGGGGNGLTVTQDVAADKAAL